MSKRRYEFKITIREVIVSFVIVLFMIAIGLFISNIIHNDVSEENEKYFKSLKINDDSTTFNYGLKTNIGRTLTYGSFKANEPVSDDLIKGSYFYIKKTKEVYTMHTRTVSYKCGKSRCHRTETYWTWDVVGVNKSHTKTFKFMDNSYKYNSVEFNNEKYLKTVTNGNVRYVFSVIPIEFKGTLYSNLKDGKLNDSELFANKTIKQVMKSKENGADNSVVIFWIVWSLLILIVVILFVALDNRYLNNIK